MCFLARSLIYFGAEEKKNVWIVATSGSLVVPGQTGTPGSGHSHSPKECCGSTSAAGPACAALRSTSTFSSGWANLCQQVLAAGMEGGEAGVRFHIQTGTRIFPVTAVPVFFLLVYGNKKGLCPFNRWQSSINDGAGIILEHSGTRKHDIGLLSLSRGKNNCSWSLEENLLCHLLIAGREMARYGMT